MQVKYQRRLCRWLQSLSGKVKVPLTQKQWELAHHITLLRLGSQSYQQAFSFRFDPISRNTAFLEAKGIPNMHRANMQKEVVPLCPSEVAMMSTSCSTDNTQQSVSSRCSALSKEQLWVQTSDRHWLATRCKDNIKEWRLGGFIQKDQGTPTRWMFSQKGLTGKALKQYSGQQQPVDTWIFVSWKNLTAHLGVAVWGAHSDSDSRWHLMASSLSLLETVST